MSGGRHETTCETQSSREPTGSWNGVSHDLTNLVRPIRFRSTRCITLSPRRCRKTPQSGGKRTTPGIQGLDPAIVRRSVGGEVVRRPVPLGRPADTSSRPRRGRRAGSRNGASAICGGASSVRCSSGYFAARFHHPVSFFEDSACGGSANPETIAPLESASRPSGARPARAAEKARRREPNVRSLSDGEAGASRIVGGGQCTATMEGDRACLFPLVARRER